MQTTSATCGMSVCRSASFIWFYLIVTVVAIASSQGEAIAETGIEYWYDTDGNRHDCTSVENPYEVQLCPCEREADAVIVCKSDVLHVLGCWPHDKGVAECDRRRGFATSANPNLAVRDFASTPLGLRLNISQEDADHNILSFTWHMNSFSNASKKPTTDGAALNTTTTVIVAMCLCGAAVFAMLALLIYWIGKNKRHLSTNKLKSSEALQMCIVNEGPD